MCSQKDNLQWWGIVCLAMFIRSFITARTEKEMPNMYDEECPVCGEEDHAETWSDQHELLAQLQPSLHSLADFYVTALIACKDDGAHLPEDWEAAAQGEFAHEVLYEAEEALPEGVVAVSDDDYWSLWRV